MMERYYYVSMMGTSFNYYYDYTNQELITVLDAAGENVNESMKMSGRGDSAQTTCSWILLILLMTYFSDLRSMKQ